MCFTATAQADVKLLCPCLCHRWRDELDIYRNFSSASPTDVGHDRGACNRRCLISSATCWRWVRTRRMHRWVQTSRAAFFVHDPGLMDGAAILTGPGAQGLSPRHCIITHHRLAIHNWPHLASEPPPHTKIIIKYQLASWSYWQWQWQWQSLFGNKQHVIQNLYSNFICQLI